MLKYIGILCVLCSLICGGISVPQAAATEAHTQEAESFAQSLVTQFHHSHPDYDENSTVVVLQAQSGQTATLMADAAHIGTILGSGRDSDPIIVQVANDKVAQLIALPGVIQATAYQDPSVPQPTGEDNLGTHTAQGILNSMHSYSNPNDATDQQLWQTTPSDLLLGHSPSGRGGAGKKIGIISDSFNALGGYDDDVTSGRLPGVGNPQGNTTPVTVVQEGLLPLSSSSLTDEGRAMAQVIYQIAPEASLYFSGLVAFTSYGMISAISKLVESGCTIIVDDVGLDDIPFFQQDMVSSYIDQLSQQGIIYLSAAGNGRKAPTAASGDYSTHVADGGAVSCPSWYRDGLTSTAALVIPEGATCAGTGSSSYETLNMSSLNSTSQETSSSSSAVGILVSVNIAQKPITVLWNDNYSSFIAACYEHISPTSTYPSGRKLIAYAELNAAQPTTTINCTPSSWNSSTTQSSDIDLVYIRRRIAEEDQNANIVFANSVLQNATINYREIGGKKVSSMDSSYSGSFNHTKTDRALTVGALCMGALRNSALGCSATNAIAAFSDIAYPVNGLLPPVPATGPTMDYDSTAAASNTTINLPNIYGYNGESNSVLGLSSGYSYAFFGTSAAAPSVAAAIAVLWGNHPTYDADHIRMAATQGAQYDLEQVQGWNTTSQYPQRQVGRFYLPTAESFLQAANTDSHYDWSSTVSIQAPIMTFTPAAIFNNYSSGYDWDASVTGNPLHVSITGVFDGETASTTRSYTTLWNDKPLSISGFIPGESYHIIITATHPDGSSSTLYDSTIDTTGTASQISLPLSPTGDSTVRSAIGYVDPYTEKVHLYQYSELSTDPNFTNLITDTVSPGATYYVRSRKGEEIWNTGTVTIDSRPAAPDSSVLLSAGSRSISAPQGYEIAIGDSDDFSTRIDNLDSTTSYTVHLRRAATDSSFHSESTTVTIRTSLPQPQVSVWKNRISGLDSSATYVFLHRDDGSAMQITGQSSVEDLDKGYWFIYQISPTNEETQSDPAVVSIGDTLQVSHIWGSSSGGLLALLCILLVGGGAAAYAAMNNMIPGISIPQI